MIELAGTNSKVARLRRLEQRRAVRDDEGCIVVEAVKAIADCGVTVLATPSNVFGSST